MSSPKRATFLDFDFEIESTRDSIFPLSDLSPNEPSRSEAILHEHNISTRQSFAFGDKRRSSITTFYTENLPLTPEPDDSFGDLDTIYSNQHLSPAFTAETTEPTDEAGDKHITEPQHVTEYEAFTAQAWGEQATQTRRQQTPVDRESNVTKDSKPQREPGRRLILIRVIGRIAQVVLSITILMLVVMTISKVTASNNPTQTGETPLWPPSMKLSPEYLTTIVAGLSITLSLLCIGGSLLVQSMSESNGGLARFVNPIFNIVLLAAWAVAVAVFKANSDDTYVIGYSCSHSSDINNYITFASICTREIVTWTISVVAAILEFGILITFLFTLLSVKSPPTDYASDVRMSANLRKPKHMPTTVTIHSESDGDLKSRMSGGTITKQ